MCRVRFFFDSERFVSFLFWIRSFESVPSPILSSKNYVLVARLVRIESFHKKLGIEYFAKVF